MDPDPLFMQFASQQTNDFQDSTQLPILSPSQLASSTPAQHAYDDSQADETDELPNDNNSVTNHDPVTSSSEFILWRLDSMLKKYMYHSDVQPDIIQLREDFCNFIVANGVNARRTVTGSNSSDTSYDAVNRPHFSAPQPEDGYSRPLGAPRCTIHLGLQLDPSLSVETLDPDGIRTLLQNLPMTPWDPLEVTLYDAKTKDGLPCRLGRQSHGNWKIVAIENDVFTEAHYPEIPIGHQQSQIPHIQIMTPQSSLDPSPVSSSVPLSQPETSLFGASPQLPPAQYLDVLPTTFGVGSQGRRRRGGANTTSPQARAYNHQTSRQYVQPPGTPYPVPMAQTEPYPAHHTMNGSRLHPTNYRASSSLLAQQQCQQQTMLFATSSQPPLMAGYSSSPAAYTVTHDASNPMSAHWHQEIPPMQPQESYQQATSAMLNGPYIGSRSRTQSVGTIQLPTVPTVSGVSAALRIPAKRAPMKRMRAVDADEEGGATKKPRGRPRKQKDTITSA